MINIGKAKTTEQFKQEVFNLVGNEYIVNSEYTGVMKPIELIHTKCNFIFTTTPNRFLKGCRCPKCQKVYRRTHEEYVKELNQINPNIEVLGIFSGVDKKIKHRCKIDGYEWNPIPANLLRGSGCPKCEKVNKRTLNEFKSELYDFTKGEYEYVSGYKGYDTKCKIKHVPCGFEYEITPYGILKGIKCSLCAGHYKDTNMFKQEIFDLVGDEYSVVGEYHNATKKVMFLHKKCNKTFLMTPDNFLHGQRCTHCCQSKGAHKCEVWLLKHKINFKEEYGFEDLLGDSRQLKFDFAIFNVDNSIKYLLEYDGEFHYKPILCYKDEPITLAQERLNKQQRYDQLKNEYCYSHNINLIRIPYWNFDKIEHILNSTKGLKG